MSLRVDNLLLVDGSERMDLAKAWVKFDGVTAGTPILDSFGVDTITDVSLGAYTANWTVDFLNINYSIFVSVFNTVSSDYGCYATTSVGAVELRAFRSNGAGIDVSTFSVLAFGDQV